MGYGFGIGAPTTAATPTTQKKTTGYGFGIANADAATPAETAPATPFQSVVKTLSPSIGGGALNIIPGQPQTVVNTGHTDYAKLPPVFGQERDDIVPVSLGGSNQTKENLRYEPMLPPSKRKPGALTPSDVYLEQQLDQFKSGKQSLAETRLNVLTFKQKQEGLTPTDTETKEPGGTGFFGDAIDKITSILGSKISPQQMQAIKDKKLTLSQVNADLWKSKNGKAPTLEFPVGQNLKKGSMLPPAPGLLRESTELLKLLPKDEPVTFGDPKNQYFSENAKANVVLNIAYGRGEEEAAVGAENEAAHFADYHPIAAMASASSLFLGPAAINAPVETAAQIAIFEGLSRIEDKLDIKLSRLSDNPGTKDVLDTIQMIGNGALAHEVYLKTPSASKVVEAFTKNIITNYNLPKRITIPADVVRDIFQTGTKITDEQMSLFKETTAGDRAAIKNAIDHGLDINVPAEKVVQLVDKPYWAEIKNRLKIPASEPKILSSSFVDKPTEALKGFLPSPEAPLAKLAAGTDLSERITVNVPEFAFGIDKGPATPLQTLVAAQKAQIPAEMAPGDGIGPKDGQTTDPGVKSQKSPTAKTLYHGSKVVGFQTFDKKFFPTDDVQAFFFSPSKDYARYYSANPAEPSKAGDVVTADVDLKKPYIITNKQWQNQRFDATALQEQGYDGIIVQPPDESASAFDRGAFGKDPIYAVFDPKSIDIKHAQSFQDSFSEPEPKTNQQKSAEALKQPTEVKMARSQMPVGEGKERVSRLEARMKDALGQIDEEMKDKLGLQTYNQMNKEENIAAAAKFVAEKPEDAIKVLTGEMDAPPGVLRNSVYVALQNAGAENADLARKVASIGSTRLGQELSILTEIDKNSPVSIMSDIVKFREAAFEKKTSQSRQKVKKAVDEAVDAAIKKAAEKSTWESFIDEIICD